MSFTGSYKFERALKIVKENVPPEGYFLCFSGGKDSIALYRLAQMAGVKFDAYYHYTTVDPPEVVKFIKTKYPDVTITKPMYTMWELIVKQKALPLRTMRYCCKYLKEINGKNRVKLIGIRAQESSARARRYKTETSDLTENCSGQARGKVHPILAWKTRDVWDFINEQNLETPDLYNRGWKRIGCIGCPCGSKAQRERDFKAYPKIKLAYMKAIERMLEQRKADGMPCTGGWETTESCFEWWINI